MFLTVSAYLRSYARCGAEGCYDCSGYRCYNLHDKLDSFLLTHNFNVSLGFAAWLRQECLMFNVKGGALGPKPTSQSPFRRLRLNCLLRYYYRYWCPNFRPGSDYHRRLMAGRSQDPPQYLGLSRLHASLPYPCGRSR